MAKWADYLISEVHYNSEHTHIEKVKQHIDSETIVGAATITSRSTVVSNLKSGYTYKTIRKGSDGKWRQGEDVRIIKVGSEEFIRTDANGKASDNLGELPEF